jgi:ethanolamine permease
VASFHGIILAAGRATFEFGRVGYAPKILGTVHSRFKTPAYALILNMCLGIMAILTGKTGEIITIACFGALGLYIISMISFFALRKKEPNLERPFTVPFYPAFPGIALVIASISIVAMTVYNPGLALIYFGVIAASMIWFHFFVMNKDDTNRDIKTTA